MNPQFLDFVDVVNTPTFSTLDPLRLFLNRSRQEAVALQMENFSVEPYLYLCKLAYDTPSDRLRNQYFQNRFHIFHDRYQNPDNFEKRFAVTCSRLPKTLIIVFKGTDSSDFADLRSDMRLTHAQLPATEYNARVFSENSHVNVLAQDFLQGTPNGQVILTGHSLGGAIACDISKAHPTFDVVTFNMGSYGNRMIREEHARPRTGVGLHIRAHGDIISSNAGDDGSHRNVLVTVRLPDTPGVNPLSYHGVEFLLNNVGQINAAILRRLGYQQGGRRRRQIKGKLRKPTTSRKTRKTRKSRKARKSRKSSSKSKRKTSRKLPGSRRKTRRSHRS